MPHADLETIEWRWPSASGSETFQAVDKTSAMSEEQSSGECRTKRKRGDHADGEQVSGPQEGRAQEEECPKHNRSGIVKTFAMTTQKHTHPHM
jgi:hypothetical protein